VRYLVEEGVQERTYDYIDWLYKYSWMRGTNMTFLNVVINSMEQAPGLT
jgi:hypothetical protein